MGLLLSQGLHLSLSWFGQAVLYASALALLMWSLMPWHCHISLELSLVTWHGWLALSLWVFALTIGIWLYWLSLRNPHSLHRNFLSQSKEHGFLAQGVSFSRSILGPISFVFSYWLSLIVLEFSWVPQFNSKVDNRWVICHLFLFSTSHTRSFPACDLLFLSLLSLSFLLQ